MGRSKGLSGSPDKYWEELNDRPVDRARERGIPAAPRRDATASQPGTSLLKPIRGIVSVVDSRRKLEHDPEKHALGLDPMGGNRFSEKIVLKQRARA
jgi:hypothetical protein